LPCMWLCAALLACAPISRLCLPVRLTLACCLTCRLKPGETWTGEMVIRSFDTMWERPLFDFDNNVSQPSEAPPPAGDILPPRPNFSSPGTYG